MASRKSSNESNGATLGFEQKLWKAADKMRGHMDPGEYKHVALGLIFLKYISDSFEEQRAKLAEIEHADPEDPDEYRAENVFWVPKEARWEKLQAGAKQPEIGKLIDDAMTAIERENPTLKGVLPKTYARPQLDKTRLGELVDLIGTIGLGDAENRSKDILGRVYEYFLTQFASKEGKKGGEFYTPRCVVQLLVEMIEPYKGRVYDPCCGSSGMFVQSEEFILAHGGKLGDISIYGQESNPTTWRLAKMNLAIRGIEANLGPHHADSFHNDLHKDLKADYILANPPFNLKDWGGEKLKDDVRWKHGVPPATNANFAWVQHIVHHLAPGGTAGFILANGSLSSQTSGEGDIREALVRDDLVDCIVSLPGQLFYGTGISACLWFVSKSRAGAPDGSSALRDRRGEVLFIDARRMGSLVDRVHRELSPAEIERIARTYHAWQAAPVTEPYEDVPGLCRAASLQEVAAHSFVLSPGRYVEPPRIDRSSEEPFEVQLQDLVAEVREHLAEASQTNARLHAILEVLDDGSPT